MAHVQTHFNYELLTINQAEKFLSCGVTDTPSQKMSPVFIGRNHWRGKKQNKVGYMNRLLCSLVILFSAISLSPTIHSVQCSGVANEQLSGSHVLQVHIPGGFTF